jgi:hypothetical protein
MHFEGDLYREKNIQIQDDKKYRIKCSKNIRTTFLSSRLLIKFYFYIEFLFFIS